MLQQLRCDPLFSMSGLAWDLSRGNAQLVMSQWHYDAWRCSHAQATDLSHSNKFYNQTRSTLGVSKTSAVAAGFCVSRSTSETRHPSLYLSSGAANTASSVSPATLSTGSNRKAASICSADAFAEFAVTGSSRVLYSFFQV